MQLASKEQRDKNTYYQRAKIELAMTDFWAMSDYDQLFTDEKKAYRQALREVVRNPDPSKPFPVRPA